MNSRRKLGPTICVLKTEQKMKLGLLKLKKGQGPGNVVTAIAALRIEYMNKFTEADKVAALVSAAEPQYEATIHNKMKRLKSAKGDKEVTCDVIVKNLCKLLRTGGSGKGIIENPSETEIGQSWILCEGQGLCLL